MGDINDVAARTEFEHALRKRVSQVILTELNILGFSEGTHYTQHLYGNSVVAVCGAANLALSGTTNLLQKMADRECFDMTQIPREVISALDHAYLSLSENAEDQVQIRQSETALAVAARVFGHTKRMDHTIGEFVEKIAANVALQEIERFNTPATTIARTSIETTTKQQNPAFPQ